MAQRNMRDRIGSFIGIVFVIGIIAAIILAVIYISNATSVASVRQQNQNDIYKSLTQ